MRFKVGAQFIDEGVGGPLVSVRCRVVRFPGARSRQPSG